jgi:hypothetical protein
VLAMNPAREVKTERFSRSEDKTLEYFYTQIQLDDLLTIFDDFDDRSQVQMINLRYSS